MTDNITILYEPFYSPDEMEETQQKLVKRLEKLGEDMQGVQFCFVYHPDTKTYLCILSRVVVEG